MFVFRTAILTALLSVAIRSRRGGCCGVYAKRYSCRGYPNPPCNTATTEEDCLAITGCTSEESVEHYDDGDERIVKYECVDEGLDCGYYSIDNQVDCEAIGCVWNEYWTQRRLILSSITTACFAIVLCSCLLCTVAGSK